MTVATNEVEIAQQGAAIAQLAAGQSAIMDTLTKLAAGQAPAPTEEPATLAIGGVAPVQVAVAPASAKPTAKPLGTGSAFTTSAECVEIYQAEDGSHHARIDVPINLAATKVSASGKTVTVANFSGLTADGAFWANGTIGMPTGK